MIDWQGASIDPIRKVDLENTASKSSLLAATILDELLASRELLHPLKRLELQIVFRDAAWRSWISDEVEFARQLHYGFTCERMMLGDELRIRVVDHDNVRGNCAPLDGDSAKSDFAWRCNLSEVPSVQAWMLGRLMIYPILVWRDGSAVLVRLAEYGTRPRPCAAEFQPEPLFEQPAFAFLRGTTKLGKHALALASSVPQRESGHEVRERTSKKLRLANIVPSQTGVIAPFVVLDDGEEQGHSARLLAATVVTDGDDMSGAGHSALRERLLSDWGKSNSCLMKSADRTWRLAVSIPDSRVGDDPDLSLHVLGNGADAYPLSIKTTAVVRNGHLIVTPSGYESIDYPRCPEGQDLVILCNITREQVLSPGSTEDGWDEVRIPEVLVHHKAYELVGVPGRESVDAISRSDDWRDAKSASAVGPCVEARWHYSVGGRRRLEVARTSEMPADDGWSELPKDREGADLYVRVVESELESRPGAGEVPIPNRWSVQSVNGATFLRLWFDGDASSHPLRARCDSCRRELRVGAIQKSTEGEAYFDIPVGTCAWQHVAHAWRIGAPGLDESVCQLRFHQMDTGGTTVDVDGASVLVAPMAIRVETASLRQFQVHGVPIVHTELGPEGAHLEGVTYRARLSENDDPGKGPITLQTQVGTLRVRPAGERAFGPIVPGAKIKLGDSVMFSDELVCEYDGEHLISTGRVLPLHSAAVTEAGEYLTWEELLGSLSSPRAYLLEVTLA